VNEYTYDYMADIDAAAIANKLFVTALTTGRGPEGLVWRGSFGGSTMCGWRMAEASIARAAEIEASKVFRDACPYCAVRADVGCKHNTL
jgi:hypothetical protein